MMHSAPPDSSVKDSASPAGTGTWAADPVVNEPLRNRPGSPIGIRLGSVRELLSGPLRERVSVPHRVDFHVLLFVRHDSPVHTVDFEDHQLRSGAILWVRPGQIHRFTGEADAYDVGLLSVLPDFLPPDVVRTAHLDGLGLPTVMQPTPADAMLLRSAFDHLTAELDHAPHMPEPFATQAARHAAASLLLHTGRLALNASPKNGPQCDPVFVRFREEVERHFATSRSAVDYARRIGYSRRSLDRAVQAATGQSAKSHIDRRVVLEAKRLLAHTELTVGRVGERLGFADTANFARYFKQHTGVTPLAFREREHIPVLPQE